MSQALSYAIVNWSFEPDTMAEKEGGVMLKFSKTKAKTSFTNLRRYLLVAIDEDDVSKNDIKFRLVRLENAMNEVMELILETVLESREDEAALYNISEEAGELEKQYTDAVTRANTVLAELSNYNSARTSEVTWCTVYARSRKGSQIFGIRVLSSVYGSATRSCRRTATGCIFTHNQ